METWFSSGETLTFVERNFLPYDDGHTIVFRERKLYLQEDENKEIIDSFAVYVSRGDDSQDAGGEIHRGDSRG